MRDEDMDFLIDVDLKGVLICFREAIPALRKRGGGSLIATSSVQATHSLPGCVVYAAAKAAVVAAVRTLALEVGKDNIRTVAVSPGTIDTPMLTPRPGGHEHRRYRGLPAEGARANTLGRIGTARRDRRRRGLPRQSEPRPISPAPTSSSMAASPRSRGSDGFDFPQRRRQGLRRYDNRRDQRRPEVADGEFVVFVGPSGCGKSTLLRMIAGLETITSGEVRINGKVVNDVSARDRDIAMVFQSYALYPQMTVRAEHRLRHGAAEAPQGRDRPARRRGRAHPRSLRAARPQAAASSRAASASASRWAAPSCAIRRRSCSTSRCPTSTPSCGSSSAPSSAGCTRGSASRRSTSPTTRSRR